MTTRTELLQSMKPYASGAWISTNKLREWLGNGSKKTSEFTKGLSYRLDGNRKLYLCIDVAEKMRIQIVRDSL